MLVANNLLVGELVVIHGTALGPAEFQQMGQAGTDLAWSPLSNLLLYGDTTDVVAQTKQVFESRLPRLGTKRFKERSSRVESG